MDITTIIGIIAGLALIFLAVKEHLFLFWNTPSMMITFGGAFAATLINYPFPRIIGVFRAARKVFFSKPLDPYQAVDAIVTLSKKSRREGLISLESEVRKVSDEFLRKGIQYIADGTDKDVLRHRMEKEISFLQDRHRMGQEIFVSLGTYCPAFGMIGTLMGLILMLHNLDDPKKVGPGMAVAIITTFYGALAAYLIFLPIAGKLKVRSQEEVLVKEVVMEGLISLLVGEPPRVISEKLRAFIAPRWENIHKQSRKTAIGPY